MIIGLPHAVSKEDTVGFEIHVTWHDSRVLPRLMPTPISLTSSMVVICLIPLTGEVVGAEAVSAGFVVVAAVVAAAVLVVVASVVLVAVEVASAVVVAAVVVVVADVAAVVEAVVVSSAKVVVSSEETSENSVVSSVSSVLVVSEVFSVFSVWVFSEEESTAELSSETCSDSSGVVTSTVTSAGVVISASLSEEQAAEVKSIAGTIIAAISFFKFRFICNPFKKCGDKHK